MKMLTSFDKVYKDEVVSFDTPYSEGGLYVNLNNRVMAMPRRQRRRAQRFKGTCTRDGNRC